MSSKTATEICKNVEELSNKVFSHNVTPKVIQNADYIHTEVIK
jgi:hypothetical protein